MGQTESRDCFSKERSVSSGLVLIAIRPTGTAAGITGLMSTMPSLPLLSAGIGVECSDYLGNPDDLFALVRMVEEGAVAKLHRPQIVQRLRIAHAVPMGAAIRHQLFPRITRWFRFEQPISHECPFPAVQ